MRHFLLYERNCCWNNARRYSKSQPGIGNCLARRFPIKVEISSGTLLQTWAQCSVLMYTRPLFSGSVDRPPAPSTQPFACLLKTTTLLKNNLNRAGLANKASHTRGREQQETESRPSRQRLLGPLREGEEPGGTNQQTELGSWFAHPLHPLFNVVLLRGFASLPRGLL